MENGYWPGAGGFLPHFIDPIPIPPPKRNRFLRSDSRIVPIPKQQFAKCFSLQIREMEMEQSAFLEVQDKSEDFRSRGPLCKWLGRWEFHPGI